MSTTPNPEYDDAKDIPLMFRRYGAASAGKSEAVGTFFRNLYSLNIQMTEKFRRLLLANGIVDTSPYEWLNDEAWYRGEPIENRATDNESRAIAQMQGKVGADARRSKRRAPMGSASNDSAKRAHYEH